MNISFEKAKELSIIKWTGVVNDTAPVFDLNKDDLLALKHHYNCGFCLRYGFERLSESNSEKACKQCEFGAKAGICTDDSSLYGNYTSCDEGEDDAIEAAEKILAVIIDLKKKEEC